LNVSYRHTWKLWDDFVRKGSLKADSPAIP
jgi:hypothetical protein